MNLKICIFEPCCRVLGRGRVPITDDVVNELLKVSYISEERSCIPISEIDQRKRNGRIHKKSFVDQQRVMRGLQVRPWDDDFEREAGGFCGDFERVCGRGEAFQISSLVEPFESLTLSFSDDRISIYATGRKFTWEGRTYTDYGIPL